MSIDVVRKTSERILEHCETNNKKDAAIVLHGGEPLLGGINHLEMIVNQISNTFAGTDIRISVGIQSNGLLFTSEIGDLLLERGISIGISIDGPPPINDIFRLDHQGMPTSAKLESKLNLLLSDSYKSIFSGFLCVINIDNDPIEVTKYLQSLEPVSIDFLFPLDNHDRRPHGKKNDVNLTPYADWLIKSFDYWFHNTESTMRIRIFNSIINQIFGHPALMESIGVNPVDLIVIETNGDIEGVDSLKSTYEGATNLGFTIFDDSFDKVAEHEAVKFRQKGINILCKKCIECPVVNICGGGYLPHRFSLDQGFNNPSIYCSDLEKLIRHIHTSVTSELKGLS